MLDIKLKESENEAVVCGVLAELDIEEKTTLDGRKYVTGKASIQLDQEIDGVVVENVVPVRMFAMKKKNDGTDNGIYKAIMETKEKFTSLAAAEEPSEASLVCVRGKIEENIFIDNKTKAARSDFQISSNFLNKKREVDEIGATFSLLGVVVGDISMEEKDGEETGRLKVKVFSVGYKGKIHVLDLIVANPSAIAAIQSNWEKGDTVCATGIVNMTYTTKVWYDEQGFGDPIRRVKTESRKELIITGGDPNSMGEDHSYDANDIKNALAERQVRITEMQEKSNSKPKIKKTSKKSDDFGF